MSKEKPTDDPRQQTDWGSHKQTDQPLEGESGKGAATRIGETRS